MSLCIHKVKINWSFNIFWSKLPPFASGCCKNCPEFQYFLKQVASFCCRLLQKLPRISIFSEASCLLLLPVAPKIASFSVCSKYPRQSNGCRPMMANACTWRQQFSKQLQNISLGHTIDLAYFCQKVEKDYKKNTHELLSSGCVIIVHQRVTLS